MVLFFFFHQDCSKNGHNDGSIDHAFRKVRKNSVGFHIWKVEVREYSHILSRFSSV